MFLREKSWRRIATYGPASVLQSSHLYWRIIIKALEAWVYLQSEVTYLCIESDVFVITMTPLVDETYEEL